MKIRPKIIEKEVDLLTNPDPTWMAIVDHGANQTPWAVVKGAGRLGSATPQPKKGSSAMSKTNVKKKAPSGTPESAIQKVAFNKSKFATEQSVIDWLTKNEWDLDSLEIEETDDAFVAKSIEYGEDDALANVREVKANDDNVTAFIGELTVKDDEDEEEEEEDEEEDEEEEEEEAEGDDEEEEEEEDDSSETVEAGNYDDKKKPKKKGVKPKPRTTAKSDGNDDAAETRPETDLHGVIRSASDEDGETTTKFDWWSAYYSDEQDLVGVMRDGISYDGTPPGFEELLGSVRYTAGNILSDDNLSMSEKRDMISKVGSDFAVILSGMYEIFESLTDEATNKSSKTIKTAKQLFFTDIADAISGGVEEADDEEAEDEGGETATKSVVTINGDTLEEAIAKAVKDATGPLHEEIETLKKGRKKQKSKASASPNDVSEDDAAQVDKDAETAKTKRAASDFASMMGVRSRS